MILNGLLERLAAFEPNGFPVVSLYLNTQPDQHGRDSFETFTRKEFRARAKTFPASSSDRESFDRDVERITAYLEGELRPSANSAVIFACAGADLFETLQLDAAIPDHRLYIYDQPHLYGLALLNDEYPRYAAVVADTNSARLFVFGLGQVLGKDEITGVKTRGTKVGGWSQARYQRRVDNQHSQHAKEVVEALDRIVREDRIAHIVLAGDEVVIPKIREQLPAHLESKVIDVLRMDVNAPEHEVLEATLNTMRKQDEASDSEKVGKLFEAYRAGGLAVVGPRSTLAALQRGQVDELLLSASLEQLYSEEEEIREPLAAAAGAGAESAPTRTVLLPDELVTKAAQTGASVSFIQDPELLAGVGGAAGTLRFRI